MFVAHSVIACDKREAFAQGSESDEAIHRSASRDMDCFASLAMTKREKARIARQSVIAIARSAWRSRADNFSVSDFNWPHAARMSRPRGVRTGEE